MRDTGFLIGMIVAVTFLACEGTDPVAPSGDGTLSISAGGFAEWSLAANIESAPPGADADFNTSALEGLNGHR